MLLVGVPAGALADRFDRRTVLIRTEIALTASLTVFAVPLINGAGGLIAALTMSALSGVLRSLHHPARLRLFSPERPKLCSGVNLCYSYFQDYDVVFVRRLVMSIKWDFEEDTH